MSQFHDDLRKVDRANKVQELTRVWHEIIDTRRWQIEQVYGADVAKTYTPLLSERDFFVGNGRLPHPEDFRFTEERDDHAQFKQWNEQFWAHCAAAYPDRLEAFRNRRKQAIEAWQALPGAAKEEKKQTELEGYIAEKLAKLKR
jgi:hypothetical protein